MNNEPMTESDYIEIGYRHIASECEGSVEYHGLIDVRELGWQEGTQHMRALMSRCADFYEGETREEALAKAEAART